MTVSSDITLRPATADDLDDVAYVYHAAFSPGRATRAVYGKVEPAVLRKHFAGRMSKVITNPNCAIIVARRDSDGKCIGFAFYDKPQPWKKQEYQERPQPDGTNMALASRLFRGLHEGEQAIKEERYHLHMIAVDPTIHKSGVGRRLLNHVHGLAERDGVPVYLEALEDPIPVYEHVGYQQHSPDVVIQAPGLWWRPMVWRSNHEASSAN